MDTKQTSRTRRRPRAPEEMQEKRPAKPAPRKRKPSLLRKPERTQEKPRPARKKSVLDRPPRKPDIEHEVIYTPPKPFNRNRLLLQITVVVAVVVALFFSMSLFFKVDTIIVGGNHTYGIDTIVNASGIKNGDSLLSINDAKVSSLIITRLPYVKTVRIGIKLPGTVNIEIEELDVVYSICDTQGQWWLMTSEGRLVETTDQADAESRTMVLGVNIASAIPGQTATAAQPATPTEGEEELSTLVTQPVTLSAGDRLNVALAALHYLEENDIIGQMTSVDVTDMGNIVLMYGDQFRIVLGDSADLSYKISLAVAAIGQLREHDRGTLDISFIDRPEVVYTPQND